MASHYAPSPATTLGQALVAESSVVLPPEAGSASVPNYRLFRLSSDSQIVGVSETVAFDSDSEVIKYAKAKLDILAIEVWDGLRVVIRLKSTDK